MNEVRPYYLNLMQMRLPIGGWVSILHRASGALLSLAIPGVLYVLMLSLRAPEDFRNVAAWLGGIWGWLLSMALIWALLHHFLAGLRHLGFDFGWGEERYRARKTAWASLIAAAGLTALIAVWRLA
ncbi:MAG: succinate dehydrogenase, cytochrome b556 subunit [Hydrogenophilales bacterium 28-61-23]|nr:MAG: succinate dehydrogenase, cytochrome b556 subunit [Hydrogenophilales bacterium 28-61-23]